jgi:hypothetical protein
MKPELKAKMFVALVISFLAFGVGSGAGLFAGLPGNNSLNVMNLTQPGELPMIFNQPSNTTTTQTVQSTQPSQNTEQVYQEPVSQPSSGGSNSSSSSNSNNNKPTNSSN